MQEHVAVTFNALTTEWEWVAKYQDEEQLERLEMRLRYLRRKKVLRGRIIPLHEHGFNEMIAANPHVAFSKYYRDMTAVA